jgi:hypothetical protein
MPISEEIFLPSRCNQDVFEQALQPEDVLVFPSLSVPFRDSLKKRWGQKDEMGIATKRRRRLRACFENGWRGRPARPGRRPADRNCRDQRCEKAVPIV